MFHLRITRFFFFFGKYNGEIGGNRFHMFSVGELVCKWNFQLLPSWVFEAVDLACLALRVAFFSLSFSQFSLFVCAPWELRGQGGTTPACAAVYLSHSGSPGQIPPRYLQLPLKQRPCSTCRRRPAMGLFVGHRSQGD